MKKFFSTFLTLTLCVCLFVSCSDDDDDSQPQSENYKEYPYSSLTPEQQKEKLDEDGLALTSKIEGLTEAKGMLLLESLVHYCKINKPDINGSIDDELDIIYIKDFYGKYTWNKTTQKWDKSESADKLVFILPAKKGGENNNGRIELTGVSSGADIDEYELPKSSTALLFVDDADAGTISVKGTDVNGESLPTSAEVIFDVDDYKFTLKATKGAKNNAAFTLVKGSETLLDGFADLDADLDEALIDEDFSNMGNGNSEIKIMNNLLIYGDIDFKNAIKETNAIEAKYDAMPWTDETEKAYEEELVAVNNKYSDIVLASRDNKTKIATLKQRVDKKNDTFTYWDDVEEVTVTITRKYYNSVEVFKFNDNTSVDVEVYFSAGFDKIMQKWEDFVAKYSK